MGVVHVWSNANLLPWFWRMQEFTLMLVDVGVILFHCQIIFIDACNSIWHLNRIWRLNRIYTHVGGGHPAVCDIPIIKMFQI